jgi:hypothetical protein
MLLCDITYIDVSALDYYDLKITCLSQGNSLLQHEHNEAEIESLILLLTLDTKGYRAHST